jgi:hypothetical protein
MSPTDKLKGLTTNIIPRPSQTSKIVRLEHYVNPRRSLPYGKADLLYPG